MRFTINVEKRFAYAIIGTMLILAGLLAVTAYGTSNPQVFGHTASEIAPGVFGGAVNSVYSFPGSINVDRNVVAVNLTANGGITLGGVRRTSWPADVTPTNPTVTVSSQRTLVEVSNGQESGSAYDVFCPPNMVIVGLNYDPANDDHVESMYCAPLVITK